METMISCVTLLALSSSTGETSVSLCEVKFSFVFRRSKVSDKSLKIFPGAKHQLFLELESTRSQVYAEIETWIESRI